MPIKSINMKRDIHVMMHKISVIAIVSSLAISAITCAPQLLQQPSQSAPIQQQQGPQGSMQQMSAANSIQRQQAPSSTTTTSTASTTPQDQSSIAPEASNANGQPSTVFNENEQSSSSSANPQGRDGAQFNGNENDGSHQPAKEAGELDMFYGKSPFTDAGLWQIPLHLINDLSPAQAEAAAADDKQSADDQLTNSASETSSLNDEDDEEQAQSAPIYSPQSGPVAASAHQAGPEPAAVVLTPADLKTAAGYHYPSHGGHHGGQSTGHYDGHGYYQYASVPKPNTWESGYRRGNSKHTIERHDKAYGPHFSTKVKWSDKHGHGVHTWEYNHDDHHSNHGDHYDDESHHGPAHGHHEYPQKKHHSKKHY